MKIEVFRSKLRIRFTYQKRRYSVTIGENLPENHKTAKAIIIQLKADIRSGNFDDTLSPYKQERIGVAPKSFPMALYYSQWLLIFGNSVPYNVLTTQRMINKWDIKLPSEMPNYLIRQSLAPNTFNNRLNILKRFAKWLVKYQLIHENPLEDIVSLKVKMKREQRKPFEDEEIALILDALQTNKYNRNGSKYYDFVKFMFMTGVRNAEAIGLQVRKIDFTRKLITIDQTLARTRKGSYANARIFKSTKTGSSRFLPMDKQLEILLRKASVNKAGKDLVFTSVNGKAIDDQQFQKRVFKPMLKYLGIPERDLYATRHTFGTMAIEQGINPIDAGYLMGHSNPKTVLTCYSHLRFVPKKLPSILEK
jgi:integrase